MKADPRLPELFERACELDGKERAAWLAEVRRDDPALATEIEELLRAAPGAGELLESPAWERLEAAGLEPPLPERVGSYRIVREVGHGGMGRVFLAEQEEEDFRRRVALKLLDRPVLREEDVQRFRREVRLLASLEHLGIARFLDGGRAPDGTWYLALEYVEGMDLTSYVASRDLSLEERVQLFLAVLEPVAHAHAHAVVHRDLKPSNILVGQDGRPRLLDFGIAKLLDPDTGEAATLTRTELRAFTPAYASPEQIRGEPATAASDVHSLGVILYELLTGVSPYQAPSGSRAALERAVLTEDPAPPSTASRRRAGSRQATGGDEAAIPLPPPGGGRVSADLDAICLKALRKEPSARYPDASALAEDLRRYLAGLPVEARRGGRRYRVGRFLLRNRTRLATAVAATLAVAAVAVAVVVTTRWERRPPLREPGPAPPPGSSIQELERFFAAAPESLEAGGELALALSIMGRYKEAKAVIARMRQIPGTRGDPLTDAMEAIIALRMVEPQRALALTTRALDHPRTAKRLDLRLRIRGLRAVALSQLGRRDEARAELEWSVSDAEERGDALWLSRVLIELAIEERHRGELDRAEQLLTRALPMSRRFDNRVRGDTALAELSYVAQLRGRYDLAEDRLQEALSIMRLPAQRGLAYAQLSRILRELGRPQEVAATQDRAIALLRDANDNTGLALAFWYRGEFEIDRGRHSAIEGIAQTLENTSQESGELSGLAFAELMRARLATVRGDQEATRRHYTEARRLLVETGQMDYAASAGLIAARMEREVGNVTEAERLTEESVRGTFRRGGVNEFVFQAESLLARIAAEAGRTEEATRRLAALGPGAEHRPGVSDRLAFLAARSALARRDRRFAAARSDLETAIADAQRAWRKLDELDLRLELAETYRAEGDHAAAAVAARQVADEAARLGLAALESRARRFAAAA